MKHLPLFTCFLFAFDVAYFFMFLQFNLNSTGFSTVNSDPDETPAAWQRLISSNIAYLLYSHSLPQLARH